MHDAPEVNSQTDDATVDRRRFLKGSAGVAGALAMAGPLQGFIANAAGAAPARLAMGPLADSPDLADGVVRLALPAGYVYRSFSATGDIMSDGNAAPGRPDGMAAFVLKGNGRRIRVVRNHEINASGTPLGDPSNAYDGATLGGTTTLEIDARTRELMGDWVSLTGTSFNCAGGPTTWRTWLSVEETVNGPDVGRDFAGQGGDDYQQRHGYLYEVDSQAGPGDHQRIEPIRSVGRFPHEAVAWNPRSGHLYQSEDQFLFPAGIYRYKPPVDPRRAGRIVDGGVLEMLRIKGASSPTELGGNLPVGHTWKVDWVTIPEPDFDGGGASNDEAIRTVSMQGFEQNAAKFARPEGMWYDRFGNTYFTCTSGGGDELDESNEGQYGSGRGQVWRLDGVRGNLELIFQSNDPALLDAPDNLTISRRGTIVLCEDGREGNYVRLLERRGGLTDFAMNRTDRPDDEFAGACLSPDGRTLFVNIQASEGRTFAIWREDDRPIGF